VERKMKEMLERILTECYSPIQSQDV
jgi:hypothetical protein